MPVNWQDKVTPVDAQNLGIMQDDITEVQTNVDNLEEDMNTKFADVEEEISDKVSTLETSLEAEIEEKYAEVTENVKTNTTNISALQSSVESINTQLDIVYRNEFLSTAFSNDWGAFSALGTNTLYLYRRGTMVTFRANVQGQLTSRGSFLQVFELPEAYRPANEFIHSYVTQEGYPMLLAVYSSGIVNIYFANSSLPSSSFWLCRQVITYPVSMSNI